MAYVASSAENRNDQHLDALLSVTYDAKHDTILVVEDEAILREMAADFFEDAGYHVVAAKDADDAANFLIAHDQVNVVFTDVNMPGSMSGTELAQYVAKRWPKIGIVVVSGKPLQNQIPPDASFHSKPIDPETVLRDVRRLAIRSRLLA